MAKLPSLLSCLPCPECGSDRTPIGLAFFGNAGIRCAKCWYSVFGLTAHVAIEKWNKESTGAHDNTSCVSVREKG